MLDLFILIVFKICIHFSQNFFCVVLPQMFIFLFKISEFLKFKECIKHIVQNLSLPPSLGK